MEKARKILSKETLRGLPYLALAFILGATFIFGGSAPFGIAFLLALPKKKRIYALIGVLLSAFLCDGMILQLFLALFVFFFALWREKSGGVTPATRFLLALSCSVLRSVYIALKGITTVYGVFSLIAAFISFPFFAFAFYGYFDKKSEFKKHRKDLSMLAYAFAFSLTFSRFDIFGASLSLLPAAVFTLAFARSKGFALGGVCGIICGICGGGEAVGALGVIGMVYGLLASDVEPLAAVLSYMLGVSGYFYLTGGEHVIPAMMILISAFAVFYPLRKKFPLAPPPISAEKRAFDRKLSRYAAAFSSLSSLFYTVSDTTKAQTVTELNENIVAAVDSYCNRCDGCELDRSEISNFFTSEVRRGGVAVYSHIPTHISARCPNAYAMARSVNSLPVIKEKEAEKGLKKMADEYSAFSLILTDAAKKQESTLYTDRAAAACAKKELESIGVKCDGVRIVGERRREITVYGVIPSEIKSSPKEISETLCKASGTKMSLPELIPHDDYILLKSHTVPKIKIETAVLTEAKNGETVCGDTVSTFENDEKYFYCLIADGMGSGRDAALTSKLAAIMLEKLLTVGAEKESALQMLNKALCEKDEEVFTTVDLLEIDRINSTATIIKAGAAPSYFIRGGKASVIEAKTPPAGIMKNVVAEKITFPLEKGDVIVMLSDGIMQVGGERLIPEKGIPPLPSSRALAEKLLSDSRGKNFSNDDASVCVMRVV